MVLHVIGRQAELEAGEQFLDTLSLGPASLVIEGEPGIGKTTLWQALLDSAVQRGFGALDARPTEAEAELSLVGLTNLLADLADEVVPALPPPQRKAHAMALLKADQIQSRPCP
jgi:hypothetical protein